jgi:VIT1/CCC1 family predicted Fe2+/Mn2+ transporter
MSGPDRSAEAARRRVLSPTERISEVLFGLIMALTFTGSISVASAGRGEVREMLIGAVGCNLAWGLVDAVMYLLGALTERGRGLLTWRAVRNADPVRGRAAVAEALPPAVAGVLDPEHLEAVRRRLAEGPEPPQRPALGLDDLRGAVGVFLLVVLSTFPVVLPFVVVAEAHLAVRLSNAVAVGMLFVAGLGLGRYAGFRPLRTALAMVALGVLLVVITIALGG